MPRKLLTVRQFAAVSPFTEPQCRWFIFNARSNGLDAFNAVIRVGRRVYIDVDAFDHWIDSQNPAQRAA